MGLLSDIESDGKGNWKNEFCSMTRNYTIVLCYLIAINEKKTFFFLYLKHLYTYSIRKIHINYFNYEISNNIILCLHTLKINYFLTVLSFCQKPFDLTILYLSNDSTIHFLVVLYKHFQTKKKYEIYFIFKA